MIPGVLTQEELHGPSPPAGYTASAVHFAGSAHALGPTGINITSLSCGTDNGFFSFSFWANNLISGTNNNTNLWQIDPTGNFSPWFGLNSSSHLHWEFDTPGSTHVFNAEWGSNIPGGDFSTGVWSHFLGSAETNISGAGAKHMMLYMNDNLITPDFVGQDSTAIIIALNGKRFLFGDDTFSGGPSFDCADLWFGPNIKLHDGTFTIPTATRRQFISATGHPVNPTGWPASAVQCYGNAASFGTNHGTGGVINVIGTLTNAATHP
jgi:hypothetical protein